MNDIKGLYFITDESLTKKTIIEDVKNALESGVKLIQYRQKSASTKKMLEEAAELKKLCSKHEALLIINDRLDIALAVEAHGIHIGQDDMPYEYARKFMQKKIIGITVHNLEEAKLAENQGADYLGVSPIFATTTKADAGKPAGIKLLEEIKQNTNLPLAAIGGINLDNIESCIKAGADSTAVISAIITKDDVKAQCEKFIQKFKK